MEKVRVGVIGVGALGQHHVRLYRECPIAQLVGLYDTSTERGREIAEEFGVSQFNEMNALAAECDALSVAVPTDEHYAVVKRLLEQHKHVLVEKPIATCVGNAEALVTLAEQQDVVFGVGHVERFNPVLDCIQTVPGDLRFIEAYRLASYPPPREGRLPRGTEVSVLHDLMIHDIDIITTLVNRPISDVQAVGVPVLSPTVDIANVRLTFAGGCVANLTASRVSTETLRKIRVFKSQAYLSLDYSAQEGEIATIENGSIARRAVPVNPRNALQEELEDFCQCVLQKKASNTRPEPRVSGREAVKALKIVDQIATRIKEQETG